ncbi:Lrp/AsnC ligand binding domain-containing protein [Streptomyces sp. CA2R101]|uniref:Lrp/AsnC ligand binding domain-containing protein n=1 Tax=Streptomyces sp. CA2R101 TaxID=3120152 RepID=UPI00300BE2F8
MNHEVVEACTVSGAADAMLHMLARDIAHLEQAIQRVRGAAVIDRTESVIVLSPPDQQPADVRVLRPAGRGFASGGAFCRQTVS